MKQLYTVDFNLLLILYYRIILILFFLRSITTSFHNSFTFFPQSTISQTRLQMKKKKKKKGESVPWTQHVLSMFISRDLWVAVFMETRVNSSHPAACSSPLSPSSISSRFSPFYCSSAAPRRANLATMAATDNYYDKITAIQQSLHERYFLRFFFVVFFK